MRVLRAVFNFARYQYEGENGEPLLPDNPVERLSQTRVWYPNRRRETVIKAQQLAPWYEAVMRLKADGPPSSGWHVADYLLLLLFTGLRRQEGAQLEWANVDLTARTLTVADTKNHNDHTLPLSDFLHDLLKARREHAVNEYVFPGGGKHGHLVEPRNQIARVVQSSGVPFTLHDLRRTFLTVAESLDIPAYALKRLANHTLSADVTAGYIRITTDRLRKPMQAITDALLYHAGVREVPPAEGMNGDGGLA
jgi:integrase